MPEGKDVQSPRWGAAATHFVSVLGLARLAEATDRRPPMLACLLGQQCLGHDATAAEVHGKLPQAEDVACTIAAAAEMRGPRGRAMIYSCTAGPVCGCRAPGSKQGL
jgi:hypothetical protein